MALSNHWWFTLIELMVTMAIIGLVITLFNYDGVSSQRAAQSSQRIAHALEGILQSERLTTTLGKTQGNVVVRIATGSIVRTEWTAAVVVLGSPFFDNDVRYQIQDVLVSTGSTSTPTSYSWGLDVTYGQGGSISFSGANQILSWTILTVITGYQGAKSYKVNLDRRSGVVTIDR